MTELLLHGVTKKVALVAAASAKFSLPTSLDGHGVDISVAAQDLSASTKLEVFAALDNEDDEHFAAIGDSTEASDFIVNVKNVTARFIKVTVSVACNVKVLVA